MEQNNFNNLRLELSVKAKNGIDFISAASITWLIITFIWSLSIDSYNKSVLTFFAGGVMLPLAFAFSKLFKTCWKVEGNPLLPLGLWLNFAQLFYFPFLIFILIKSPDYFVMTYAIITGAHFFPYAWFYNQIAYAIIAGITSIGSLILGLILTTDLTFILPLFVVVNLLALLISLYWGFTKRKSMK